MNLMNRKTITLIAAAGCLLGLSGCELGRVEQGRAIAFDEAARTVTVVYDTNNDATNPLYNKMPPATFQLPEKPEETGPLPNTGKCLKVDTDTGQIAIYDEQKQNLVFVPVTVLTKEKVASPPKDRKFPEIQNGQITLYAPWQQEIITFTVPEDYASYPPDTWAMGDEVRIYFKQEGQALRFMNVSQTNIYKR